MIDVSPLMLWPVHDVLELLPVEAADSPRARRLAVLMAEAQAAGQDAAVLAWLGDVARTLLELTPRSAGRSALVNVVTAMQAVGMRSEPLGTELRKALDLLCEIDAPQDTAEAAAATVAGWALCFADRTRLGAEEAWQAATEILAVVAQAAGDAAEPAIAHCAELAYKRLFNAPSASG